MSCCNHHPLVSIPHGRGARGRVRLPTERQTHLSRCGRAMIVSKDSSRQRSGRDDDEEAGRCIGQASTGVGHDQEGEGLGMDGHDGGAMSWIRLTSVAILSVVNCSEKRKSNESVQAQEEKGMGIGGKRRGWERVFFGVS